MQLGYCRRCSGGLHLVTRMKADGEGRVVGRDGRPLRQTEGGALDGHAATETVVACGSCQLAQADHPYQKELNEAQARREAAEAARPRSTGSTLPDHSAADAAVTLDRRMAAMERAIEAMRAELSELRPGQRKKGA